MAELATLIGKLKTLPPDDLDRVEDFIRLLGGTRSQLHPAFSATFGSIRGKEADDWLKAMEECERIDDELPPRFD